MSLCMAAASQRSKKLCVLQDRDVNCNKCAGRGPKLGFEGGQTPLRLRVPKRGFHNPCAVIPHSLTIMCCRASWPLTADVTNDWIMVSRSNVTTGDVPTLWMHSAVAPACCIWSCRFRAVLGGVVPGPAAGLPRLAS